MRKKTVRRIWLAVILCAAFILCISCSGEYGGTKEEEAQVQLHLWGVQGLNEFGTVIEKFEEAHPDIKIVYHLYNSADDDENLKLETTLLAGGSNVDLYFTYTTQALSKRIKARMAMDLTDLCARDGFDMTRNFTENVTKFYYGGRAYAVPTSVGKMGMILNKDMFDRAGIEVPLDWDFKEFREICKKLTYGEGENKVYGVFWNTEANASEALLHLVLPTLGGDPLYKEGGRESNINDPVIEQALRLLDVTMNVDKSAPDYRDSKIKKLSMKDMFFGGYCAMTVGAWMFSSAVDTENNPHDFVTAFAPWPVVDKSQRNYTQGSFGCHLSINPNSQNKEAAWTFIKWYATEGVLYNIKWGYLPCYTGFSQETVEKIILERADGVVDKDSTLRVLLNPDTNMSIPVIDNKIDLVTEIFDYTIEEVLAYGKDAPEALSEAKAMADEELNKN